MEDLVMHYLRIMYLVLKILRILNQQHPSTRSFKNGEIVSLTLRITDQNNNVITDGPGTTVVLHIRDRKICSPIKMEYGKQLNLECSLRTPKGIKGTRQKVIVTHNPSEIDQAQELLVRFPNLAVMTSSSQKWRISVLMLN